MKKQEKISRRERNALLKIAMKNIYTMELRGDFEYRMNDEEDFLDVSVGSLETALTEAYLLGKRNGEKNAKA